jgi:NodT family efflux transporter outer membrane factor (OMF) lipoprotein
MKKNYFFIFLLSLTLCACTVGPNYVRPNVNVPEKFKEAPKGWKTAEPKDTFYHGEWWKIFNDPELNSLELQLNNSNQSIATAEANYRQARALVDEARASYFPIVSASAALTRQITRSSGSSSFQSTTTTDTNGSTNSTSTSSGSAVSNKGTGTSHSVLLDATWEPDIWGAVRRSVEASTTGAEASDALLAATRLSSQATLAQTYYQLRTTDIAQHLLDQTVSDYKKSLALTQHRYASGVVARTDVVQAQSQLQSAQALAINNKLTRSKFEHAIAVLIGITPAELSLAPKNQILRPPKIPSAIPSSLLERRPDVAQAERLMAQANAQIGVAISAYFPTLSLSATATYAHSGYNNWFSVPGLNWALGPQLAQTIFDGGLRSATVAAARAGYDSTVASYRQTVLAAFQDTEDNLASVRLLKDEATVQRQAANSARLALKLVMNQYKSGTVAYSDVITAQTNSYNAEKIASDVVGTEMTSAVGLIKSLGGGWDASTS